MHPVQIVQPGQVTTRKLRTPSFPVVGAIEAMGLYPSFFTPVLPGETLDQHTYKATVVSQPLANPLTGAFYETYLFYVRLTDIDVELADMFVGTLTSSADYEAPVDRPLYFTKAGQIDWCYLCTQRIHEHFFRDEDEVAVLHPDGVYMIKRINSDVFDSAVHSLPGPNANFGGDTEGEEISPQLYAFLRMRNMGLGVTSYEEYLQTYGLRPGDLPRRGEPELLAYRRYWAAPANAIDPTTGAASGAWYWRVDESHTKPKRFNEPGFVIGFHSVRPKLYDARHVWPYTSSLWGFEQWIPSYTLPDPAAGLREVNMNAQPWVTENINAAAMVYIDHRDLLTNGEQFNNGQHTFNVPASTYRQWSATATNAQLRGEYVNAADLEALFATAANHKINYDGIHQIRIKGHVQDMTR